MKPTALFLVWLFAMLTSEATARIPDFWVRLSSGEKNLNEYRLIALDLRFRYGVTIGIADLPSGWAATVQKDSAGIFSVQLVASEKSALPARLDSLLACVTICPNAVDDRYIKVEFVGGEAFASGEVSDPGRIVNLKIEPAALTLTQDTKVIPATKNADHLPQPTQHVAD
jgi:hypothetical protein